MEYLITTIIKRPYVLLFLLSYIIIATKAVNWRWMILFLLSGYTIAFFSEYLSINYGFPYGWYFYKYENLKGEWLNHGVPVWDSVSYVFMCYAGLYTAHFSLNKNKNKIYLVLFSALLVTILDIIIDPVSHLGKRWFLGDIYYYPKPGWYFDITMANFAGWFLVSALINSFGVYVLKFNSKTQLKKIDSLMSLGLYFGIFGFGLAITVYLQEWLLLLASFLWFSFVLFLIITTKKLWTIQKAQKNEPS